MIRNGMIKLIGISVFILNIAFSQGVVTQMEKGSVDYSAQAINAVGIGFVEVLKIILNIYLRVE